MATVTINNKTTLYVGGFDYDVNEQILHAAFVPFGEIVAITIPPDPTTEFESKEDAAAAIDNMHLSELYGKVIKVNLAKPNKDMVPGNRAIWTEDDYLQKYTSAGKKDDDEDDNTAAE
ncbi:hypothetical protein BZG36_01161 [Bifiguratus adelaidae]|uniref:RRM domain-containing protein n=1 Tax=Bifiguratus adelaidae TaxID=1938954 RepID=A0A261Y631_9FUNG|nr:hypothetical protein BZG36_01161 [Bifiguratus adelaidae]